MKRYCIKQGNDIKYSGFNGSIARIISEECSRDMTTEDLDKDIDTDVYLLEMALDRLRHKIEARFQEIPECMEDLLDELIEWIDERRENED